MSCFLITYDLVKPGRDYPDLYDRIKSLGAWCHPVESNWFVVSTKKSAEIREHLTPVLDKNDKLIVLKLTGEAAWRGLSDADTSCLKSVLNK